MTFQIFLGKYHKSNLKELQALLKVLIICPENIFPAKDGVSKAIESLYIKLSKNRRLKIVFTSIDNQNIFYKYDIENQSTIIEENFNFLSFDVYIASPLIPAWKIRNVIPKNKIKIALLSDCYTYVLWRNIIMSLGFRYFSFKELKSILKLPLIYLCELIIARKFDFVLFQTEKDIRVASKLFKKKNFRKSTNILKNEDENLIPININREGIGWVASFDGDYIFVAHVFFKNVLSHVLEKFTNTHLYILGKRNEVFVNQIKKKYPHLTRQIHCEVFYSNISDFYFKRKICVTPVYKGYGLINKTLESLYYGCVTIGDKSAFNGISGFKNLKHGFIGKNNSDFIKIINENLQTDNLSVTENAKTLIKNLNKDWILNDFISQYLMSLDKYYQER